jgi:hypothetical protein
MGTLTSHPYDVSEGQEYAGYLDHVLTECHRLVREGRVPSDDGILAFLEHAAVVLRRVQADVASAGATGRSTIQSQVPMTPSEHQRYVTMNDSLRSLLEILELRDALALNRTEAVGRVSDAFLSGEFVA